MSEEDVKNIFDSTIYYDEKYNQIITTSDTKVANIAINEKKMTVNNSNISMLDSIIRIDNNIYLPISDMEIVYNIKISYIENTKRVVIDELDTGMIRATGSENTDIKFKPRGLSKNIGILKQGEIVNCFYTTSKGWRQIRTSEGIIGYVKANKLSNDYILRQDMQDRSDAIKIQRNDYDNKLFEVADSTGIKKIILKDIFNVKNNDIEVSEEMDNKDETIRVWASISNKLLENQTNSILQDYKSRTILIDTIVNKAIENNINGISIDFTGIESKEDMIRFAIECAPKLREIGISTCIVLNDNIEEQDYISVVDYIVE